jgi:NitT/TauT family transport system permease protein
MASTSTLIEDTPAEAGIQAGAHTASSANRRIPGIESAALFILLLAAWQAGAVYVDNGPNTLFPSPLVTARALRDSMPELLKGTYLSFLILLPGFGIALVSGVALGLAAGTVPWVGRTLFPFGKVAAPIPPSVYIPYAIAILPTFRTAAIFTVFIGAFWPIFQNAAAGAHSVEQRHRDNARVLGMTAWEYLLRVVFPASLPHIFSGMAVGLGFSFILLTVSELFGAHGGLGRFVQYYADFGDYPRMVAGILYTGFITFLCMSALEWVRRRALFWLK